MNHFYFADDTRMPCLIDGPCSAENYGMMDVIVKHLTHKGVNLITYVFSWGMTILVEIKGELLTSILRKG